MSLSSQIKQHALEVFENEGNCILQLKNYLDDDFSNVVEFDVENPINIQILLRKVAKFLRVIGRPDLAQFIHKKTREIYKYQ